MQRLFFSFAQSDQLEINVSRRCVKGPTTHQQHFSCDKLELLGRIDILSPIGFVTDIHACIMNEL